MHMQVMNRIPPNSTAVKIAAPARLSRISPLSAKPGKAYLTKKTRNAANDPRLKTMPATEPAISTQAVMPTAFESTLLITFTTYRK